MQLINVLNADTSCVCCVFFVSLYYIIALLCTVLVHNLFLAMNISTPSEVIQYAVVNDCTKKML